MLPVVKDVTAYVMTKEKAMPSMKQPDAEKLRDLIIKHAPQAQYEEKAK